VNNKAEIISLIEFDGKSILQIFLIPFKVKKSRKVCKYKKTAYYEKCHHLLKGNCKEKSLHLQETTCVCLNFIFGNFIFDKLVYNFELSL
jgi:hypothetical protein